MFIKCIYLILINALLGIEMALWAPKENPYLKQFEKYGYKNTRPENKCVVDRPYDLGTVCKQSNEVGFMAAVEYYLRQQLSLIDRSTSCPPRSPDYLPESIDFIVVGAGATGCVIGRRLADAGYSVLMIEAGGPAPIGTQVPGLYFQYNEDPDITWNFKLEKQNDACLSQGGVCYWPRGKVMGGTTQLHGMMYMRGYPQDFDNLNLTGWSWDEVMPFYLKSEDNLEIGLHADPGFHATGGLLTVSRFRDAPKIAWDIMDAAAALGYRINHDMNGEYRTGFTIAQATNRHGERLSQSRAYLYDINGRHRKPRYPIVVTNALVTKVVFDSNNNAVAVEFEKDSQAYSVRCRKEIILSAGTVQSPQILMLSGVGPQEHLEKIGVPLVHHLPGVGKNLRNHVSFSLNFHLKNGERGENLMNIDTVMQYLTNRTGPLTSTGLSQLTGFTHTKYADKEKDAPDLQVFFAGYLANCSIDGDPRSLITLVRQMSITPTLLRPESVGYLELADQYARSPPKIYANLLKSTRDIKVLLEGIKIVLELARTSPLDKLIELDKTKAPGCLKYNFGDPSYWECAIRYYTNPENHQVGTCKMGHELDEMAVVDERLRVYGVQNLRVADSSVLPVVPSGNLVAPAIMVGEKGAQYILDDWKKH